MGKNQIDGMVFLIYNPLVTKISIVSSLRRTVAGGKKMKKHKKYILHFIKPLQQQEELVQPSQIYKIYQHDLN